MRTVIFRLLVCVLISLGLGSLVFLAVYSETQAQPAAAVGPDLHVAKDIAWPFGPLVEPGGIITFGILVENLGAGQAQGVVVTDTLPDGLSFVETTNSPCGGPCPMEMKGQQVIWQLGDLSPDTLWRWIEFSARVAATVTVGTSLTNTVEIRGKNAEVDSNPNDENADPYANNRGAKKIEIISTTPDLDIYKYVSAGVVAAGESLRYEIMLINQGEGPADNVVVTDTLPLSVTYLAHGSYYPVGAPVPITPTVSGRHVVWNLGRVPRHERGYLTVDVRVSRAVTVGATLTNVATVSTSSPELAYFSNESTSENQVESNAPNLGVTKFSDGQRAPGGRFDYRIYLTNRGGGSATGVRVTDTLPAELRFITSTSQSCLDPLNPDNCQTNPFTPTVQGQQISWEIGRVSPGIDDTYIVATVEVSPSVVPGTMITNVVRISGSDVDSDPNDDVYTATLPVVETSAPDIGVFKVLESGAPRPGGQVVYRLHVINQGAFPLNGVILTDTLPVSLSLRSASSSTCFTPPACVDDAFAPAAHGRDLVWNLGQIAVHGHGQFWVTADVPLTVTAGTIITNTARISTSTAETDLSDNASQAGVMVFGEPRLAIGKTAPALALQGHPITYTLAVSNTGDAGATGLVITDAIPAGAFLRSVSGGVAADGTVTWTLPTLAAGSHAQVSFVVTATETISNSRYRVRANEGASATGAAAVTTTVIALTATHSGPALTGATVHFTATLSGGTFSSGTPMTYQWRFGDGSGSSSNTAPIITHSYTHKGDFTAVVTATNSLGSLAAMTRVIIEPHMIYLPLVLRQ